MSTPLQQSPLHGYGVFATEDLAEDYVGIPMEGTFLVYDCISDALESAASDGVPRYGFCVTDQLRKICVSSEGVRDTAALYLMPDPCSPWFYLNTVSSVGGVRHEEDFNVLPEIVFSSIASSEESSWEGIFETLGDPAKGIILRLSKPVPKGQELLVDYPLGNQQCPVEGAAEGEDDSD